MRFFHFPLLLLLFCSAFSAWAFDLPREELEKLSRAATLEKYPDANSVLLFDREEQAVRPDGGGVYTDVFYSKPLTEKGRRGLLEIPLRFHAVYETMEVVSCRRIAPDGSVTEIDPAKNTKIVIDNSQMASNIYDPEQKVMMLTIPGLQVGDILKLELKQNCFKPRMKGVYSNIFGLQGNDPILRYEISVSVPESFPLNAIAVKDEVPGTLKASRKNENGRIVYEWVAENVPAIIPEPDMPESYLCSQRLLVSTAPDWQFVSRWYWNLSRPHLEKITPEMKKFAAALVGGAKTPDEKMMVVFQFVSQKIRYMGVTPEKDAPGYEPHDVDLTFRNRYGVCRDKAALLVSLLRAVGFEAYPVLFFVGSPKDSEVPNCYFNHAVAAVKKDGKYLLMDPTYETATEFLPAAESEMSYLVATPEGETLRRSDSVAPEKNLFVAETTAKADDDGNLTGETVLRFFGMPDPVYRGAFSRWPSGGDERFFRKVLRESFCGAELDAMEVSPKDVRDMSKKLEVRLKFHVRRYFDPDAEEQLLELPGLGLHLGGTAMFDGSSFLKKRRFPLQAYATAKDVERFELTLPERFTIAASAAEKASSEAMDYARESSFDAAAGTFAMTRTVALKRQLTEPEQYFEKQKVLQKFQAAENRKIVLRRNPGKLRAMRGVNAVISASDTTVEFPSCDRMILTSDETLEVLTYAGVKENSERRYDYFPAFEKVELLSASVTSPDGKVHTVSPGEIHVMDQGWVGAAPDYPAGKSLTVKLPSVEIGSVIRVRVRRETGGKLFSGLRHTFAFRNPARSCSLTLSGKAYMEGKVDILEMFPLQMTKTVSPDSVRWEKKNIPALIVEPESAFPWTYRPAVILCAGQTPQALKKLHQELLAKTENQQETAKLVSKLVEGKKTDVEKLRAIRDYAAVNIREAGPWLHALPPEYLTPADVTLARKYGSAPDRAILLYAMARAAGFQPEFILQSGLPGNLFDSSSPLGLRNYDRAKLGLFDCFSNLQVKVGSLARLAGTDQYAALMADPGIDCLAIDPRTGKLFAEKSALKNDAASLYDIALRPDGSALLTYTQIYSGTRAAAEKRRWTEMTPERRRRTSEELAAKISRKSKILAPLSGESSRNDELFTAKISAEIPGFLTSDGDLLYFTLPGRNALSSVFPACGGERHTPFFNFRRSSVFQVYMITPPAGYHLKQGGSSFQFKLADAPLAYRLLRYKSDAKKWILDFQTFFPEGFLAVEHAPSIRAVARKVASPEETILVFERNPQEGK